MLKTNRKEITICPTKHTMDQKIRPNVAMPIREAGRNERRTTMPECSGRAA